jgi:hypothetical protein
MRRTTLRAGLRLAPTPVAFRVARSQTRDSGHRASTASPLARLGAIRFVYRFGSALHRHVHVHCGIIDGLFAPGEDDQVRFSRPPHRRRMRRPPGVAATRTRAQSEPDARLRLRPAADWGHHETEGVDARTGKAWN